MARQSVWNRFYTKTGTDTYLNIFEELKQQQGLQPSIVANIWEEEVFDLSTSNGIKLVNNTTSKYLLCRFNGTMVNWYIRNDIHFVEAVAGACLNVANLVSIGGIVLVSGL